MPEVAGLIIGVFFGAFLFLGGLADPDKIIGTLRLDDFHAMRVVVVFVLVGMLGTWGLESLGQAHLDPKPAAVLSVLVGGALLGIGFGLTGYCPGTGLACAVAGRIDALVSVIGMLVGALAYVFAYPSVAKPLGRIANYGAVTLPKFTETAKSTWVLAVAGAGLLALALTFLRKRR